MLNAERPEEWRPVPGFPGYEVSDLGRVRSSRADKGHRGLGDAEGRHLNGVPGDDRLDNLAWGTALENARDREAHGRTARGHRQGTHTKPESRLRGERHGRALLTADDVRAIREARAQGITLRDLAERFGVSQSTIHLAGNGRNWAHLENAS